MTNQNKFQKKLNSSHNPRRVMDTSGINSPAIIATPKQIFAEFSSMIPVSLSSAVIVFIALE